MKCDVCKNLSIETKDFILDCVSSRHNWHGDLTLDSCIELNRMCLEVNKYYKKTYGYIKFNYPFIDKNICKGKNSLFSKGGK